MDQHQIANHLADIVGHDSIKLQEPMKLHTSFQIGGPADFFVEPSTGSQIKEILKFSRTHEIPLMIVGNGSNLLISDAGIRGIVLRIGSRMNRVVIKDDQVTVQAGVSLTSLSRTVLQHSLSGFEFASGIPGTMGGALAMNAGAYGGEMKDILQSCTVISAEGNETMLSREEMNLSYRKSRVQKTCEIIISADINLKAGQYRQIKFLMEDYWHRRLSKQPYFAPSGGSVFKRPEGYFTGKLIEDCGLKGTCVGGAMVSEVHAGFIVNRGGATASDVNQLMDLIQQNVKERFGVVLEPELRVIGA